MRRSFPFRLRSTTQAPPEARMRLHKVFASLREAAGTRTR